MIITYTCGNGLYINMTNRCSNACDFCVRSHGDTVYGNLWLDREPTVDEVKESIFSRNLAEFSEIVFCGYGEPTERLEDILEICREIRKRSDIQIRINTNGHASLIAGCDVTPRLEGLVDTVSISLNASNAAEYQRQCLCRYGEQGFDAMLDFACRAKKYVPNVVLSIVDILPAAEQEACKELCARLGLNLRIREMIN